MENTGVLTEMWISSPRDKGKIEISLGTPTYRRIGVKIGQRYFGLYSYIVNKPWIHLLIHGFIFYLFSRRQNFCVSYIPLRTIINGN